MTRYSGLFAALEDADEHAPHKHAAYLSLQQQEAVSSPAAGATVVIAGPGSGKTTVLVERIAYLLRNGASPSELLVCTFTRSAAEELQTRLKLKLPSARLPYCGTMHSLAYRMLGGPQWLLKHGLALIGEEDQLALLHSLLIEFNLDDELSEKEVLQLMQRAQEGAAVAPAYKELSLRWEEHLLSLGYVDFVMLLKKSLELPSRRRFRFALTDEAQDLTPLQLLWLRRHCHPESHTYLVGDDDQAVYAFRGSAQAVLADEIANGARCYQLLENWRCRANIVSCAQQLIGLNTHRVALPQKPTRPGGDVTLARFTNEADELAALCKSKAMPTVLCRTRVEVERFASAGLQAFTMHEAKGREWPYVWVSGLEQGMCPHALGDLEEERRLFYVALTRAKDRLVVSCREKVGERGRRASQFLREAGLTG